MASVAQTLQAALKHHQSGELDRAESLYRTIVRIDPKHADALHLLGVAAHQRGENAEAVEYIARAIAVNNAAASYHSNLGAAYRALGDSENAVDCFEEAARIQPDYFEAHYNLGTLLQERGRSQQAIASFREAVRISPTAADAHNNLGIALRECDQYEQSAQCHRTAVSLQSDFAEAHNNLGSVLHDLGQDEEAVRCHLRALELRPQYAEPHFNLGNILRDRDELSAARDCYLRAIAIDPDHTKAYINLGIVQKDLGQPELSVESNQRALMLDPESVEAHVNRSYVRRLMGNLTDGWDEYEWRFREVAQVERFSEPAWDGSDLRDKTILVYAEQGVGDEIMFASCVPELIQQSAHCIVECDPRLVTLFRSSFPDATIVASSDRTKPQKTPSLPHFGVRIAMGSVPRFTRRSLDVFPRRDQFLAPDPALVERWRARMAELPAGAKIGISWRGGRRPEVKRRRTTTLEQWAEILSVPNASFINLQYGDCGEELAAVQRNLGVTIHDWDDADPLTDLDNCAAQVSALDLVISIDNSTVHFAGAVGRPVWTLLPFSPDWRWMLEREDTPWYPSMRLFRQKSFGDWNGVFARVAAALRDDASVV